MINLILLSKKDCIHCARTKEILNKIKPEYPELNITEIDMLTEKGQELVGDYSVTASPGVIINNQLFSMGGIDEKELKGKLDSLK